MQGSRDSGFTWSCGDLWRLSYPLSFPDLEVRHQTFITPTCLPLVGCYLDLQTPSISGSLGLPGAMPLVPRQVSKDLSLETDAPRRAAHKSQKTQKDHLCQPQTLLLLGCFMSEYISSQSQAWNAELTSDIDSLHPRT